MNSQRDIFAPPYDEGRSANRDLRDKSAWTTAPDRNGVVQPNVITSVCGRYTIVRYPAAPLVRESFGAFRKGGTPDRWQPPTGVGNFQTATEARWACAAHAEAEVQR